MMLSSASGVMSHRWSIRYTLNYWKQLNMSRERALCTLVSRCCIVRAVAWPGKTSFYSTKTHMDTRVVLCGSEFRAMIIDLLTIRALNRHTASHVLIVRKQNSAGKGPSCEASTVRVHYLMLYHAMLPGVY
jgi:hypothetical protein